MISYNWIEVARIEMFIVKTGSEPDWGLNQVKSRIPKYIAPVPSDQ